MRTLHDLEDSWNYYRNRTQILTMLPNSNTSNYIQSRLGLQQPRSAPGPSRIRSVTSVPPKREGIVWSSVSHCSF